MNDWQWQLLEAKKPVDELLVQGTRIRPGSRVRLRPRAGGDIMDLALSGKTAIVDSIEEDYEGKMHVAVVVDDDPGRDIGLLKQPGHRFFFSADEIEVFDDPSGSSASGLASDGIAGPTTPRILIAGIGNIFLGDDAFGVELARRLAGHEWPEGSNVRVVDFGIRSYDLTFALLDGHDVTLLLDACPRGGLPGSLYVIEPNLADLAGAEEQTAAVEAHSMNPLNVLRLASSLGPLRRVLLLGCEPETTGPEEGQMGLSRAVEAALEDAVGLVDSLVRKITSGDQDLAAGS